MFKLHELICLFVALIPLSRCVSIATVTENEAVQIEFPYPCDSNTVTIQNENNDPFYSSTDTANLHLPNYQLHRFSVTDGNCSVQVQINPVKRSDEATYIGKAYRNGVIRGRFTKKKLNVNYPPGNVSCTFSINNDTVGDWVPLQCTAPVGSLAGGIYCYEDSKRLPPWSKLVQNGKTMKQAIWIRKEYSVFCCSSILDQPKDTCECKDFVWDPMGNSSHSQTNTIIDPCPATTPGATLSQYPGREELPQLIESLKLTHTNKDKSIANNLSVLPRGVIFIVMCLVILVTITLYLQVEKANKRRQQRSKSGGEGGNFDIKGFNRIEKHG